jgi:hypothetical protein
MGLRRPGGIKIFYKESKWREIHHSPAENMKLTRDPAEHRKALALKPSSGNQSGSGNNRGKVSDIDSSSGEGRDGITMATKVPTVPETLETIQVEDSSTRATHKWCDRQVLKQHFSRLSEVHLKKAFDQSQTRSQPES